MSDQPEMAPSIPSASQAETETANQQRTVSDPSNSTHRTIMENDGCEVIKAPHVVDGHTFVVTTVIAETVITDQTLKAVPVRNIHQIEDAMSETIDSTQLQHHPKHYLIKNTETSRAVVPLSTSLPSKLLRFHAKRSAQSLLENKKQSQSQSIDSQFGSDEGAVGGSEESTNDCADIYNIPPNTSALSSSVSPNVATPPESLEEKLVDVGMGSSIEDSEESAEEDDELKPLAMDNHVIHDPDLNSPVASEHLPRLPQELNTPSTLSTTVLSEANLEKFRRHQHSSGPCSDFDNIYLHPNFKYEIDNKEKEYEPTLSPPPAIAPANSPVEQKRAHRSFLTMKKSSSNTADLEAGTPNLNVTTDANTEADEEGDGDQTLINEVDTLDPSLIPNDELASEITDAVEFYFSNDSILKDAFLLKHVRRNKEGFVSLKLVSSFKRVRQLTKDWRVVGNALRRKSHKIQLNELGSKVRRLEPLPNFDETMPSRTIVACDLPLDKLTIDSVSEIFSKCGEIALIRILKPGMAIPVDVRQFMNKYPEMQMKECALIEYLESSSAREARTLQGPFQVFEMVAPKKKTGKKAVIQVAAPVARMVENYRYYNDVNYERTRGGSFSGVVSHDANDLRFKLKRNNSDFHPKSHSELVHQNTHAIQQYHHHHSHHSHHSPTHRIYYGSEGHPSHYQSPYQPRNSIANDTASNHISGSLLRDNSNINFYNHVPRRYSNTSTISAHTAVLGDTANTTGTSSTNSNNIINNHVNNIGSMGTTIRRLSNCSDNYSTFSEMSRRTSNCSENTPQRRDSNCSDNCPCSRRVSDFGQPTNEVCRKTSQSSIGSGGVERRFSNGSLQFERTFSNASNEFSNGNSNNNGTGFTRRLSNDFNFDRRQSIEAQTGQPPYENDGNVGGGGGGYMVFPRRYSNNFNNISSKMASYDNAQYINGRRISTDSGYDRRYSFGSEYEGSPRSRTSSFLNNYKNGCGALDYDGQPRSRTGSFLDGSPRSRSGSLAQRNTENLVRTPIGPDGSRGFGSRARKLGQTVSPVN